MSSPTVRFALLFLAVFCLFLFVNAQEKESTSYRPVVLWHGMGDTCCFPFSMGAIKKMIEDGFPGIYVYSVEVGNNIIEDELNGYFMNVNEQLEQIHGKFQAHPELADGFTAIGFSQGGQFLRGYVERYNDPPVYNLITMGGQHQGVFGFPNCPAINITMCEELRRLITLGAYEPEIQAHVVQAEYWQDPFHEAEYVNRSVFLADINNQGAMKNETYKENLMSLNQFVMVMFTLDTMVQPKESEWFAFYAPGQDKVVVPLNESQIYTEDWLGLREMDEKNQLKFIPCPGNHLQFTQTWFKEHIFPYLDTNITSSEKSFLERTVISELEQN